MDDRLDVEERGGVPALDELDPPRLLDHEQAVGIMRIRGHVGRPVEAPHLLERECVRAGRGRQTRSDREACREFSKEAHRGAPHEPDPNCSAGTRSHFPLRPGSPGGGSRRARKTPPQRGLLDAGAKISMLPPFGRDTA